MGEVKVFFGFLIGAVGLVPPLFPFHAVMPLQAF